MKKLLVIFLIIIGCSTQTQPCDYLIEAEFRGHISYNQTNALRFASDTAILITKPYEYNFQRGKEYTLCLSGDGFFTILEVGR